MGHLVLIVDDHELIRNTLSELFQAQGFNVCQAVDGAQAIAIAEKQNPDLIVLDLTMPVMNGLEAARALQVKMPGVPLMMFTNTVGPFVEREARSAGILKIFSKAEPPSLLVESVKAHLS